MLTFKVQREKEEVLQYWIEKHLEADRRIDKQINVKIE